MQFMDVPCQIDVTAVMPIGDAEIRPALRFSDFKDRRIEIAIDSYASNPQRMLVTGGGLSGSTIAEREILYKDVTSWLKRAILDRIRECLGKEDPDAPQYSVPESDYVMWGLADGSFRAATRSELPAFERHLPPIKHFGIKLTRYLYEKEGDKQVATPCLFYSNEF